jgi:hypothetical protein
MTIRGRILRWINAWIFIAEEIVTIVTFCKVFPSWGPNFLFYTAKTELDRQIKRNKEDVKC